MENYEYLKYIYDKLYTNNLNINEFKDLIDKKFKKRKEKKELIKNFLNIKKEEVLNLENEIVNKCNDKILLVAIKNYYNGVNQLGTFNIKFFINKLKQFDGYINYLKKINFKLDIEDSINELKNLKEKLENPKYFNIFNNEIKDINIIIDKLKETNINYFDEEYFKIITKEMLKKVKEKNRKYQNGEIINKPVKINNEVKYKEEQKQEIKKEKVQEKIIKKNDINKEKIKTDDFNINKYAFKFFEYCKMKVIKDIELSDEQVIDICNYIDILKEEFKYLFMTTLDSKNKKKVLDMILNADTLIEKEIYLKKEKQKIKKMA